MHTDTAPISAGLVDAAQRGVASLASVKLDDKYTSTSGLIFILASKPCVCR